MAVNQKSLAKGERHSLLNRKKKCVSRLLTYLGSMGKIQIANPIGFVLIG